VLARYIFALVTMIFLGLGTARFIRGKAQYRTQGQIWLMMGVIFGAVSTWLYYQG
jgi:hypothetical protein